MSDNKKIVGMSVSRSLLPWNALTFRYVQNSTNSGLCIYNVMRQHQRLNIYLVFGSVAPFINTVLYYFKHDQHVQLFINGAICEDVCHIQCLPTLSGIALQNGKSLN